MTDVPAPLTFGVDHIGLTVRDLDASRDFFVICLGWRIFGCNEKYPSCYVTDGSCKITLWRVADPSSAVSFDRRKNIGLHHLALKVATRESLDTLFARVRGWPGVVVEFAPELSGTGPKVHAMVYEPGGNRIELSWDPR
jgi:catechol 2,3-dioxygenase-like lactoylglutathione lyase family enzyme